MTDFKTQVIKSAGPLSNFTFVYGGDQDNSLEARTAREGFQFAVTRLLSRYAWSSFTRTSLLTNGTDVSDSEDLRYSRKFVLPKDFYRLLNVSISLGLPDNSTSIYVRNENTGPGPGGPNSAGGDGEPILVSRAYIGEKGYVFARLTDYELKDNYLYANSQPVSITYLHGNLNSVGVLPGNFLTCLIYAVASYLATSLGSNFELSRYLESAYEMNCRVAILNDRNSYRQSQEDYNVFGGK